MEVSTMAHDADRQHGCEELRVTERRRLRSLVDADMETAIRLHADDSS
jgi:hypothetical protein